MEYDCIVPFMAPRWILLGHLGTLFKASEGLKKVPKGFHISKNNIIFALLLNNKNKNDMKVQFIKSDYSMQEWENLINEAILLGCKLEYNIYGTACIITYPDLKSWNKHCINHK